jgi:tetratricopeptide (TPR) repeat protein
MAENYAPHLDRKLLLAAFRGEMPLEFIQKLGFEHLLDLCPHCRQEVQAFRASADLENRSTHVFYLTFKRQLADIRLHHRRAERELRALLALPPEERIPAIKRARRRFKGAHLVLLCLEEAEKYFTVDPRNAIHLAEVARAVIHHSSAATAAIDLLALVTAYRANALRASGDLRGAHHQFKETRSVIRHYLVTDPEMLARIDELEGSLRKDQRRASEAEELFTRAVMLYRLAERTMEIARVLLKLGDLYYTQGRLWPAVEATTSALQGLDPKVHLRLYMMGRFNLALQLAEVGKVEEAAALVEGDRDLFEESPEPWTQLRLLCLRAKIASGRGDLDTAVQLFVQAREGFIRQGIGFDVAIVSMELALLYLKQDRTAQVRKIADEMHLLFKSQDIHREAMGALLLFQEAARQDMVTIEFVEDLTAYLKRARENPRLRFKPAKREEPMSDSSESA